METIYNLIAFVLTGIIAGWLAGKLIHGRGFGLKINLILGIIGSFVGGFVFWLLGFRTESFIASIIVATIGALIVIYFANRLKGKYK